MSDDAHTPETIAGMPVIRDPRCPPGTVYLINPDYVWTPRCSRCGGTDVWDVHVNEGVLEGFCRACPDAGPQNLVT